jgi:hypothetical protein
MCRHPGEEIAMNRRIRFAACLFAACTAPAFAQEGATTLPSVRVTGWFVADGSPPPANPAPGRGMDRPARLRPDLRRPRAAGGRHRSCRSGRGVGRVQVVMHPFPQGDHHIVAIAQQAR